MMKINRIAMTAIVSLGIGAVVPFGSGKAGITRAATGPISIPAPASPIGGAQAGCPIIFPDGPVAVAPNQPAVEDRSTIGIINALCDVTLDFVGCGFTPTSVTLGCDTNGDGAPDIPIPLKNITVINSLLFQATIPALSTTPGTAFPLVCCGGNTTITLSRTIGPGDDNIFGSFTQTVVCSIDLGIRAPVVVSVTPAEGDCVAGQNQLIPGSCFVLADGKPNVTSVFGVEVGNPNNVIQAETFQILSSNLIDAFFRPGLAQAGKTFLLFVTGPNGTSRNLTALPAEAPEGCPLGNEQGVQITFKCRGTNPNPGPTPGIGDSEPITSCKLDRTASGSFTLTLSGSGFREGTTLSIGGVAPKKLKYKGLDPVSGTFTRIVVKGRVCEGLPGPIVYTPANGQASFVFSCAQSCRD